MVATRSAAEARRAAPSRCWWWSTASPGGRTRRERLVGVVRAGVPARRGPARAAARRAARPSARSERWECSHCGDAGDAARAGAVLVQQPARRRARPAAASATCSRSSPELIVPDPTQTLRQGAIAPVGRLVAHACSGRGSRSSRRSRASRSTCRGASSSAAHRRLLIEGGEGFRGAIPFLERLQKKSYKVGNRFVVKRYQTALPLHRLRRRAAAARGAARAARRPQRSPR